MLQSSVLHCGPSGWSHPHWDSLVYPHPKPKSFHALEYLASCFNMVEIDSSFDRPLRPELPRLWVQKVAANPSFRFTAKLGRRFTHDRILDDAEVTAFKEGLAPLMDAGKLGCVLMQFPWSFRFTAENRDYFIRLRRAFHEFPLAAEMRHVSWTMDEAVGTFIDYHVAFCNIDQPAYTKAMPPTAMLTSSMAYVRLHGRSCFRWFQDNPKQRYDYLYSEAELIEWKKRIERISGCAAQTFVVFNNDAGGKAIVNGLQMQSLLGLRNEVPEPLFTSFPDELARMRRPAQAALFTEYHKAVA